MGVDACSSSWWSALLPGGSQVSRCAEAAWATCWSAQLKGRALRVAGGALIGNWLLPRLHVDLGSGLFAAIRRRDHRRGDLAGGV